MQHCEKPAGAQATEDTYRQRSERFARRATALAKVAGWTRIGCLAILGLALGCFMQAVSGASDVGRWIVLSVALLGVAAVDVLLERQLQYRLKLNQLLHLSSEHALARMGRCWEKVPVPRAEIPES